MLIIARSTPNRETCLEPGDVIARHVSAARCRSKSHDLTLRDLKPMSLPSHRFSRVEAEWQKDRVRTKSPWVEFGNQAMGALRSRKVP